MTGEPDLISLLYRADWTQLTLSAQVNDGSTLLIAPGRRYRLQAPDYLAGCDGGRPWEVSQDDGAGTQETVHRVRGPRPPLDQLLCPAQLLKRSRLDVTGHVSVLGRDALRVVVTRRPGTRDGMGAAQSRAGRVEALVDAELGILLSYEWTASRQPAGSEAAGSQGDGSEAEASDASEVIELVSLDLSPVIDPALFIPPPGSRIGKRPGETLGGGGLAWQGVKTAAGLAAGGLGAWIRYAPGGLRRPSAAITVEGIPRDDPVPVLSPDGRPSGPQVSDDILRLLHGSGAAEFAATWHHWADFGAMLSQVPAGARRTGFGGLGLLVDSIAERPSAFHLTSALRIGGLGQYQIDHAAQSARSPATIACDGQRRWQVYSDKVTEGPAEPASEIADLVDVSWLLECRLSGGAQVMVGDRPAYRIDVARGGALPSASLMFPAAVAAVDAELGIMLRLTSYLGGKPVWRDELRDITTAPGDFRVDIPPDLPVCEETGPFGSAGRPGPAGIPLQVASILARQAATGTAKAARNILRRVGTR
jgi:hypothetical protein